MGHADLAQPTLGSQCGALALHFTKMSKSPPSATLHAITVSTRRKETQELLQQLLTIRCVRVTMEASGKSRQWGIGMRKASGGQGGRGGEGFQAGALCVKGSEGEERKLLEDVEEELCDWCSE